MFLVMHNDIGVDYSKNLSLYSVHVLYGGTDDAIYAADAVTEPSNGLVPHVLIII